MSAIRFYYNDTISDFLDRSSDEIVGKMVQASAHDINNETTDSWVSEIEVLKDVLSPYRGHGSVFFEYNIPRMGRRADVIVIIDGIVFVLEFKTTTQDRKFSHGGLMQVWDYAIDLKNFQEGSLDRSIIPILVAPNEADRNCHIELQQYEDKVYNPMQANRRQLAVALSLALSSVKKTHIDDNDFYWAISGYEPTPTIIEAAVSLYREHTVEDITRHDGDIESTMQGLTHIIAECRALRRKAVCFVTGVPGAGKTLIGLQTAINEFEKGEKAVYLSGNYPLVEVLQEALARDLVRRSQKDFKEGRSSTKPCTKTEARSRVKTFIQMIHHYRDLYLEGTEIRDGEIVPKEGYFRTHTDKAYIPTEHIAIFDEAQRAWTKDELARFMGQKKKLQNFPYSEPEYLISCMDRQVDWGLVVCLVGGGQEINKGEAGLSEWINAINRRFTHWHVYLSDRLHEKEYAEGRALEALSLSNDQIHVETSLHLSVSMRSFRAEKVSLFVHQLLELQPRQAHDTLNELYNYPIVITRSLDTAKKWLKQKARGSERYGILACSKGERLKAISVNVRYKPDFVHWFLDDDDDIRSSNALEDTLTEFEVQGLEIDWSCVVWDADLRLDPDAMQWKHFQLRGGDNWQKIHKKANQVYQINAYRVLLTRARQGMVIVVPEGDHGNPPDKTRKPEYYDGVYSYLLRIGIPEIR